MENNKIKSNKALSCANQGRKGITKWLPRTETLILLLGLACTVWGKMTMLQRQESDDLLIDLVQVALSDIIFFASVLLVIHLLYLIKPSAWMARAALVLATLVTGWSILNVVWLVKSGVQLQLGILKVLLRDFNDLWPLVRGYLSGAFDYAVLLGLILLGIGIYFSWCFYRPGRIIASRLYHGWMILCSVVIIVVLLLVSPAPGSNVKSSFGSEILAFSSHWHGLVSSFADLYNPGRYEVQTRNIPRVGERKITNPDCQAGKFPNIVLVLLESVSYSAASLGQDDANRMPNLSRLAAEGVEFRLTRVPVSHTTKAFWAVLTATSPIIRSDYVEAIPVDIPYEGLPSILGRVGYRSGFFEMSKGTFECGPGFFNNLGFEFAWFRENLGDSSAYLGYLGGDDCRMIEPALDWATHDSKPFLLMMITSVTHDPFEVPQWFEKPAEKIYDRYLQTIRYTDYFLGKLLADLGNRGFADNTIFCVLGDHGTSFCADADKTRWRPCEEVIRVPWVIYGPGHVQARKVVEWPCSQLDVTPTLLSILGFGIEKAGFEGTNAFIETKPDRRLYFSSWYSDSPMGFVEGDRKVVYWPYPNKVFEYNLAVDNREDNPVTLSAENAERIKQEILKWQYQSQIMIDAKRYTEDFLFSHWRTFSAGRSAWAYYVP